MADRTLVGLVSCSSAKAEQPAKARDLYTSQLFRKSRQYAEATCDRWYILSAKHGLVHPDRRIAPYDHRLGRDIDLDLWTFGVRAQLQHELADLPGVHLVALAGAEYRRPIAPGPWPLSIPMKGMGIGHQLGWLTRQLAEAERVIT